MNRLFKIMIEWRYSDSYVPYEDALLQMEHDVQNILNGGDEVIWSLEHPPLYTAGTSAKPEDLLKPRFPVFDVGRGGQYTYHGPGQRIIYVMLDLNNRGRDIKNFVANLEKWVIATLKEFQIDGKIRAGRVGVWVERPDKPSLRAGEPAEDKIAAIGIRLKRWVSFHGISINIDPDLSHYDGIVPCGISEYGVTSFVDLGRIVSLTDVDQVLRQQFDEYF